MANFEILAEKLDIHQLSGLLVETTPCLHFVDKLTKDMKDRVLEVVIATWSKDGFDPNVIESITDTDVAELLPADLQRQVIEQLFRDKQEAELLGQLMNMRNPPLTKLLRLALNSAVSATPSDAFLKKFVDSMTEEERSDMLNVMINKNDGRQPQHEAIQQQLDILRQEEDSLRRRLSQGNAPPVAVKQEPSAKTGTSKNEVVMA